MKCIRSFILVFLIATTGTSTNSIHATSTNNFTQLLGSFCTSTVLSTFVGSLSGYFAKIAHEEAEKSDNKRLGWLTCWALSPAIRIALLLEITHQANTNGIPLNWIYTQSLAQIVDWLVYFEKIQLGSHKSEEKRPVLESQVAEPSALPYTAGIAPETD